MFNLVATYAVRGKLIKPQITKGIEAHHTYRMRFISSRDVMPVEMAPITLRVGQGDLTWYVGLGGGVDSDDCA